MSFLSRLLRGRKHHSALSAVPETTPLADVLQPLAAVGSRSKLFVRKKASVPNMNRLCRLEELEKRELLAVDTTVTLGAAILEQNDDVVMGDRFYLSWVTDVADPSVALQEVTFELGQKDGWAYAFFDTTADEPNGGNYTTGHDEFIVSPYSDISAEDFDYYFTYADGRTDKVGDGASSLTITFFNNVFTTGKTLIFEVDVDFVNVDIQGTMQNPVYNYYSTSNFEGKDMQEAGVNVTATFTSDQYEDLEATLRYMDVYKSDDRLNIVDDISIDPFTDGGLLTSGVVEELGLTPKPVTVSGYVYADVQWDCFFKTEDGDYGIEGVELTLYHMNDQGKFVEYCVDGKALSTVTDVNGYYEFTSLLPGTYQVVSEGNIYYGEIYGEDIYYFDKCARSQDNPISSDPLVLTTEELVGGDTSVQNNFGKVLWGTIAGNVYEDRNVNGVFDGGDKGIGGVTVELYRLVDGVYVLDRTTLTAADGSYSFVDLQYNYNASTGKFDLNTLYAVHEIQPDYVNAKNNLGYIKETGKSSGELVTDAKFTDDNRVFETISIPCFKNGIEYNFGEVKLFSVSGYVYEDLDYSGTKTSGDQAISNVTVELYKAAGSTLTLVATTKTDNVGYYEFTGLDLAETYYIHEVQPSAYINAENNIGTISGDKYGSIETLAKYSDDSRLFKIDLTQRAGYGWNESGLQYNFGENRVAVSGYVYEDRDSSDSRSVGDPGIANTRVELYKKVGSTYVFITSKLTDAGGFYKFENLDVDGEYYVHEVQPEGYINRTNTVGSFDDQTLGSIVTMTDYGDDVRVFAVNLNSADKTNWTPGETGIEYNFGETIHGQISGYVYLDRDNSGEMSSSDAPIADVTVELYRWNGYDYEYLTQTKTDSTGYYLFDDLDINEEYAVHEVQPLEYENRSNNLGTINGETTGRIVADSSYCDDSRIFEEIALTWTGSKAVNYNFGEIKHGSVSGYVYQDRNDNGVKDLGDAAISKVTVELYKWNGTDYEYVASTTTDSKGYYLFENLDLNGKYAVHEVQPSEYENRSNNVGTVGGVTVGELVTDSSYSDDNRVFKNISLSWSGTEGINYNFGEIKYGSISGYVYDVTEGQSPIAGVTITLVCEDGSIKTTSTNSAGYYIFSGLAVNRTYTVQEQDLSATYVHSGESVGNFNGEKTGQSAARVLSEITIKWDDDHNDPGDQDGVQYNFMEYREKRSPGEQPDRIIQFYYPHPYYGAAPGGFNYLPDSVVTTPISNVRYGGGGPSTAYSWHLSVVNGGYPRSIEAMSTLASWRSRFAQDGSFALVSWHGNDMNSGKWIIYGENGNQEYNIGCYGAVAVSGDWNGDGTDEIGFYVDKNWFLDLNGNGSWDDDDLWAELGYTIKDQPVSGDWDGDGKTDIGVFGPRWSGDELAVDLEAGLPAAKNTNTFRTVSRSKNLPPEYQEVNVEVRTLRQSTDGTDRYDMIDHVFQYGHEGDRAVTGDWNGDGISKIGVYNNGKWRIDVNGNGVWDEGDREITGFGNENSIPVVGDFNGDGIDEIGLYEKGLWSIDTNGDSKPDKNFEFGQEGDQPVVGDFNGDGTAEFSVYREGDLAGTISTDGEAESDI